MPQAQEDGGAAAITLRNGEAGRLFLTVDASAGTPGDFDGDTDLDIDDLNLLVAGIISNDTNFDLTGDDTADDRDLSHWVVDLKGTWLGDADLNGEFDSDDIILAFSVGKYDTGEAATWAEGDWNADGVFNSDDLISSFADGGYQMGLRPAASAVPEPSGWLLGWISLTVIGWRQRRNLVIVS